MEYLRDHYYMQEQAVLLNNNPSGADGRLQQSVEALRQKGNTQLPFEGQVIGLACSAGKIPLPTIRGWRKLNNLKAQKTLVAIAMACMMHKNADSSDEIQAVVKGVLNG